MVYCVAFGCSNNTNDGKYSGSFHKFPKEKKLRKMWTVKVIRVDFDPDTFYRGTPQLCGDHFERCCTNTFFAEKRGKSNGDRTKKKKIGHLPEATKLGGKLKSCVYTVLIGSSGVVYPCTQLAAGGFSHLDQIGHCYQLCIQVYATVRCIMPWLMILRSYPIAS